MQGAPPFPQAVGQQQPVAAWNTAVPQAQPWANLPRSNSTVPTISPQFGVPGQPPAPTLYAAPYSPPNAFPQGYGAPLPQPQWQGQPPYAQGPAFQSQIPPASQVDMQHPTNGMGVDHRQAVADSPRGAGAEQPTERAPNGTPSTRSMTSAVPPVGDIPAPVASGGPAIGGESDLGAVPATATNSSPDAQAADSRGATEKDEPAGTQGENGGSRAAGQKEDNDSHQKEDPNAESVTLAGENRSVEAGSPQQPIEEKTPATPAP